MIHSSPVHRKTWLRKNVLLNPYGYWKVILEKCMHYIGVVGYMIKMWWVHHKMANLSFGMPIPPTRITLYLFVRHGSWLAPIHQMVRWWLVVVWTTRVQHTNYQNAPTRVKFKNRQPNWPDMMIYLMFALPISWWNIVVIGWFDLHVVGYSIRQNQATI